MRSPWCCKCRRTGCPRARTDGFIVRLDRAGGSRVGRGQGTPLEDGFIVVEMGQAIASMGGQSPRRPCRGGYRRRTPKGQAQGSPLAATLRREGVGTAVRASGRHHRPRSDRAHDRPGVPATGLEWLGRGVPLRGFIALGGAAPTHEDASEASVEWVGVAGVPAARKPNGLESGRPSGGSLRTATSGSRRRRDAAAARAGAT